MSSTHPPTDALGCHGCRHLLVTHDLAWPFVCRHFGMRTRRLPGLEVEQASGEPCHAAEPRLPRAPLPSDPGRAG